MDTPSFAGIISSKAMELILEGLELKQTRSDSKEAAQVYQLRKDLIDTSKSYITVMHESKDHSQTKSKTR